MRKSVSLLSVAAMVAVAAFIVSAITPVVGAQSAGEGNGFRISPVRYEVDMEKNQTKVYNLEIENPTKSQIDAQVIINDFEAGDQENGEPKILYDADTASKGNSFKSIASAPETVTIAPGAKVTLPVTLKTTDSTNPGGYYGAVRVVPKTEDQQNISLAASVGTIFLVRVEGQLVENLEVVEFTAAKNGSTGRFFINSGKMSIVTRLKNTGNIHVKPFGTVTITSRSGQEVEKFEFNDIDPRANVLPNSTRKFVNELKSEKWFSKYTVTANLGYGTGGNLLSAKTTFWVIPTWLLVAGVVLLVALIGVGFFIYKKISTRSKHKTNARR